MRDENFQQTPAGSGPASQPQQTTPETRSAGPPPPPAEGIRGQGGTTGGAPTQGGYTEGAPTQTGYPEGAPAQGGGYPAEGTAAQGGGYPEGTAAQGGGYPEGAPTRGGSTEGEQGQAIWDAAEADRFRQRWHDVQTHFVEDPHGSVVEARQLLDEAVQSLAGCVHHREEELAHAGARTSDSTEGMRDTVLRYHQLLDRLLTV